MRRAYDGDICDCYWEVLITNWDVFLRRLLGDAGCRDMCLGGYWEALVVETCFCFCGGYWEVLAIGDDEHARRRRRNCGWFEKYMDRLNSQVSASHPNSNNTSTARLKADARATARSQPTCEARAGNTYMQ